MRLTDRKFYSKAYEWGLVSCVFLPALLFGPIWWWLVDAVSGEVVAGLVAICQLALVVTLPDYFADALVSARLRASMAIEQN
ncbi:MAG: hypothetical protein PHX82_04950 [Paracoccaceae bacterium]|nr:hypothetical protein [Paracoccaceae bacterium]